MKIGMRHIILLLILVGNAAASAVAQERSWAIGVNPFAPLGVTNFPRAEVYAEKYFSRQYALTIDLGYGNFTGGYDSVVLRPRGFRTALSFKRFIGRSGDTAGRAGRYYFGAHLFYWHHQETYVFGGVRASDSSTRFSDAMGVKRTSWGASAIAGYQTPVFWSHIFCDVYIGLGYKKLSIDNTDREYNKASGDYSSIIDCGPFECRSMLSEEAYERMNVTCGVRIAYLFYRR